MNSFYFGLSLIAILLILHWYIINDGEGQNDGRKGFLAIRPNVPAKPEAKRSTKRSFRRDQ